MGFGLFYDSSIDPVLFARDKWLDKKNGLMFPDACTLYVTAVENRKFNERKFEWWNRVYGFDMSNVQQAAMRNPYIRYVKPERVVSDAWIIKKIDMYTVQKEDLNISSKFHLKIKKNDYVQALALFFNVEFMKCPRQFRISTSPESKKTSWKQTIFCLDEDLTVKAGEQIKGTFSMKSFKNSRDLTFKVKVTFNGELSQSQEEKTFRMKPTI